MSTDTTSRGELAEPREVDHEEWRPVPGHDGYEASTLGRIRSWRCYGYADRRAKEPRIVKGYIGSRGYLTLVVAGGRTMRLHSLVMLAFVGPRPDGLETRHLNGEKLDNRPSNLVYGTHAENMQDLLRHGQHHNARLTHCKRGHEFSPENTWIRANGWRVCQECRRQRARKNA